MSGKRCPQAAADAAIPDKPSRPAPARTSPLRRGKPRPRERAARGAIAARPSCLRRARGLSSGLARGSCPRVPSGTAPHLSALPVTSWKPRCPRPGGREGGRRLREAPGGGGAGAAAAPPVGSRQSSAAVPPPVPLPGVPRQPERALSPDRPCMPVAVAPTGLFPSSLPSSLLPAGRRCPGAMAGAPGGP